MRSYYTKFDNCDSYAFSPIYRRALLETCAAYVYQSVTQTLLSLAYLMGALVNSTPMLFTHTRYSTLSYMFVSDFTRRIPM